MNIWYVPDFTALWDWIVFIAKTSMRALYKIMYVLISMRCYRRYKISCVFQIPCSWLYTNLQEWSTFQKCDQFSVFESVPRPLPQDHLHIPLTQLQLFFTPKRSHCKKFEVTYTPIDTRYVKVRALAPLKTPKILQKNIVSSLHSMTETASPGIKL